ncbi:hypothetical protein GCM10025857_09520 [Alicyclobacillus contaminans]|nr:hypothetical protein GCM10025857_09520 [Alicyclobacillus contaminans]
MTNRAAPHNLQVLLNQIDEAEMELSRLPELAGAMAQLAELREQLRQRRHQVAVFGAFSTGKSSLINALLEQPILVVSPNPTTAAITQISAAPPEDDTVACVTAKTAEQLWTDVHQSLVALHQDAENLEEAIAMAERLSPSAFAPAARRYVSFLKAVARGYAEMKPFIGTTWRVDQTGLRRFTAEEQYACFVQEVSLFTHAPLLTETGMILVDTPGVDSIHRRHTDVAFRYMQSADAILFVLYYTHAFSRADKEFLGQLAAVQDIVGTDKLFVVINAVDLATDAEERRAVRERVEKELRQLGIARPRVYEVSSQLAFVAGQYRKSPDQASFASFLRNKRGLAADAPIPVDEIIQDSGLPQLAEDLRTFLHEQEGVLAADAVRRGLDAIAQQVAQGLALRRFQSQQDAAVAAQRRQAAARFIEFLGEERNALHAGKHAQLTRLAAEWDELVFHIGERLRIRFGAMFRECFHPGRFRASGQDKQALQEAAVELAEALSRAVEAEVRTFGLRAQRQAEAAVAAASADWQRQLAEEDLPYLALDAADGRIPVPDLPDWGRLDWQIFRPAFRHFSSARQFFEGAGRRPCRQRRSRWP